MKRLAQTALFLISIFLVAVSCQKTTTEDVERIDGSKDKVNVKFSINKIEQVPFTVLQSNNVRAKDIKQVCSHIYFAVYNTSGERKQAKSQNSTDSNFGTFSLSLEKGTYRIVILAYNTKENPSSATNAEKIGFGNNGKMSDTFLWSEEVTLDDDTEKDVTLKRVVAAFRLVTTDNIPEKVAKMQFSYTGGSSTLNAITGLGCVKSRQEETLVVSKKGEQGTFEVYTFPRDDENVLKMEISALDASGNIIASQTFNDVPITRNKVTEYRGQFFDGASGGSSDLSFHITILDDWDGTINVDF